MGAAGRGASPDRAGAGRRGDLGVVRPDDLRLDRQAPRGDCLQDADEILVLAAKSGADLRDLAELAGEIYARSLPQDPDDKQDESFEERSVRLETTFDGAGVLSGDLTPECAAVAGTVLDALSPPAGAEDDRSQAQRCHDALQEAMQRLVTAGLLPERAGQPVKVWAHISLADLMMLDGSSACWRSGPRGSGPPGPDAGRKPRPAAVTAARGWMATPPRPSPAMRRWPRS